MIRPEAAPGKADRQPPLIARTCRVMGTVVSFSVAPGDAPEAVVHDRLDAACAVLGQADATFSVWDPGSPVSRLRRDEIALTAAPPEVADVLQLCAKARILSRGWFDPWAMPGGVDPTGLVSGWFTPRTEGFNYAMSAADDDMPSAAQVRAATEGRETHPAEAHSGGSAGRLNWLRAAVLGANDGIVSVAGIVIGVAGATAARGPIFTAGLAGLVAGAVSMALGEYVSVSSQRDSELAQLAHRTIESAMASPSPAPWPSSTAR